jgi:hypothetical protein
MNLEKITKLLSKRLSNRLRDRNEKETKKNFVAITQNYDDNIVFFMYAATSSFPRSYINK